MSEGQPSNSELVRLLESWFPLFGRVGDMTLRDVRAAVPILGLPHKTERANDVHRAMRENFRRVCDIADPIFTLREGADGDGLDYVLCNMDPEHPIALRWGRYNGTTIRRNRTGRSQYVHDQGMLFSEGEADMTTCTLGYTVEDDYTEAGQPCWWFGRLVLLRERHEESEVVTEVHVCSQPALDADEVTELPPPAITARQGEIEELERMIERIRRSA